MYLLFGEKVICIYLGGGPSGDGTYWIDDLGTWHSADVTPVPEQPQTLFDCASADTDEDQCFLFDHLGMVRVVVGSAPRSLEVTPNLRSVESGSLHAILDYLDAMRTGASVLIKFMVDEWDVESFANEHAALCRMEELVAIRNGGTGDSLTV